LHINRKKEKRKKKTDICIVFDFSSLVKFFYIHIMILADLFIFENVFFLGSCGQRWACMTVSNCWGTMEWMCASRIEATQSLSSNTIGFWLGTAVWLVYLSQTGLPLNLKFKKNWIQGLDCNTNKVENKMKII
jgi:hypothetical protein